MNVSGDNRKRRNLRRTQEVFGWLARVSLGMRNNEAKIDKRSSWLGLVAGIASHAKFTQQEK
jgi:hypothetical protein